MNKIEIDLKLWSALDWIELENNQVRSSKSKHVFVEKHLKVDNNV